MPAEHFYAERRGAPQIRGAALRIMGDKRCNKGSGAVNKKCGAPDRMARRSILYFVFGILYIVRGKSSVIFDFKPRIVGAYGNCQSFGFVKSDFFA